MQSCSSLPPPPGRLGALSLGLELAAGGTGAAPESVRDAPLEDGVASAGADDKGGTPDVPPEEEPVGAVVCDGAEGESGAETGGGDSGAIGAARGAGVPVADGAVGDGAVPADGAAGALRPEPCCPTAASIGSRTARLTSMPAA
jgi:hypothetical protein